MNKFFALFISSLVFLTIFFSPISTQAAAAPKIRYVGGVINYCFRPTTRSYTAIKNYKEFDTVKECEAYRDSLKNLPKTTKTVDVKAVSGYKYFDGSCYDSNSNKYSELATFVSFGNKEDCEKFKSDQFNQISSVIIANNNCTSRKFQNYSYKNISFCTFDITDTTPFKLNPSLKIQAKVDVAVKEDASTDCTIRLKYPNAPGDQRMILICRNVPIGTHEDNKNVNDTHNFAFPYSKEFFRYSTVSLKIGESDNIIKSSIYIADAALSIQYGSFTPIVT